MGIREFERFAQALHKGNNRERVLSILTSAFRKGQLFFPFENGVGKEKPLAAKSVTARGNRHQQKAPQKHNQYITAEDNGADAKLLCSDSGPGAL